MAKGIKTDSELTNEFNETKLGKKFYKPVIIMTIVLVIALIPYIYSILDSRLNWNTLDEDVSSIISGLFIIILIISVMLDAYYYGALEQFKTDKK